MSVETTSEDTAGIRAEVRVGHPGSCPIAAASAVGGEPVTKVDRAIRTKNGKVTEDFTINAEVSLSDHELMEVFNVNGERTYRFSRDDEGPCVCERIENFDLPIADVRAEDGDLLLTLYAPGLETIRDIVESLREEFGGVSIRQLTRTGDADNRDLVLVDRGRLTERQREVLQTAYELGYFKHPKGANAGEVATELGISSTTFSEHLSAAQSKILDAVLQT